MPKCSWCPTDYSTDEELTRHVHDRWEHLRERLAVVEATIQQIKAQIFIEFHAGRIRDAFLRNRFCDLPEICAFEEADRKLVVINAHLFASLDPKVPFLHGREAALLDPELKGLSLQELRVLAEKRDHAWREAYAKLNAIAKGRA